MTLYDERFDNHPVWASLSLCREPLVAAADNLADPEQISVHARIEAVLILLENRLQALDAQLVYVSALDSINSNLQQLAASLQQFNANPGSRDLLDQADNQASGILAYLAQLPQPASADVEGLREVGARYRHSMSGHIARITTEFNQLKAQVDGLSTQVAEQEEQVAAEVTRLSQVAAATETEFATAQDARREEFESQAAEFDQRVNTALLEPVETARTEADTALADLTKRANAAWDDVAAIKKRAEDASNYLGINALAAGYHETAEAEDRRAFWTRIGAIAALLGAILAAVFAIAYHVTEPFSLEGVLTKALVAVPILVLAGYLGRESSRHAERAHFNRQRQRQLESLPAYVDALEPAQRADLYEALAPGFFAPVVTKARKGNDTDTDPTGPLLALLIAELRKRDPQAG